MQCLILSIFCRSDKVPDETFNLLVSFVMLQAIDQEGATNGLHVLLCQVPFEASMRQDVLPSPPPATQSTSTVGNSSPEFPISHITLASVKQDYSQSAAKFGAMVKNW